MCLDTLDKTIKEIKKGFKVFRVIKNKLFAEFYGDSYLPIGEWIKDTNPILIDNYHSNFSYPPGFHVFVRNGPELKRYVSTYVSWSNNEYVIREVEGQKISWHPEPKKSKEKKYTCRNRKRDEDNMIPKRMMPGIRRYIDEHKRPGNFLQAIISNDLKAAVWNADDENMNLLPHYVQYFYWKAPSMCWGSQQKWRIG